VEVGGQKEADSRGRQAGRHAVKHRQAGRQAYRHAKAGWQRRRHKCMQAKTSKEAEPGQQTDRLAAKHGQVKAARDRSRQAEALV
jgi:hypothetical protein